MSKSIMSAEKRGYDGTVARVAGNLLSSNVEDWLPGGEKRRNAVAAAVATARDIVAETKRTEPFPDRSPSEVITLPTDRGGLKISGE